MDDRGLDLAHFNSLILLVDSFIHPLSTSKLLSVQVNFDYPSPITAQLTLRVRHMPTFHQHRSVVYIIYVRSAKIERHLKDSQE